MLRVYFLPVERVAGTDAVKGIEYIHDALLECTEKPDVRKLIMDTTAEDTALSSVALEVRAPTAAEQAAYQALPPSALPPLDWRAEWQASRTPDLPAWAEVMARRLGLEE